MLVRHHDTLCSVMLCKVMQVKVQTADTGRERFVAPWILVSEGVHHRQHPRLHMPQASDRAP